MLPIKSTGNATRFYTGPMIRSYDLDLVGFLPKRKERKLCKFIFEWIGCLHFSLRDVFSLKQAQTNELSNKVALHTISVAGASTSLAILTVTRSAFSPSLG